MNPTPHDPDTPAPAPNANPSPASNQAPTPSPASSEPAPPPHHRAYSSGERFPALTAAVLLGVSGTIGLLFLALQFSGVVRVFPLETFVALVFAAATLAFGFWILRRIRPVRAPHTGAAVAALAWGLTAAPAAGIVANGGLSALWSKTLGLELSGVWGAALTAPVNEELIKLAGVVFVVVMVPHAVRGPVDGFVVGSLAGLGFEVTENVIYALNAMVQTGGTGGVQAVVQTTVLRVGLTGLGSHWALSAIAGTAVGLLAAVGWRPGFRRAVGAALLVLLATALHWLLDAPVFGTEAVSVLVKVLVIFTCTMAVYFVVRHTYRRRVRAALASEGESLGMRPSAATAVASRHGRRGELRHVAWSERTPVLKRQEEMLAIAEERAARYPA